MPNLLFVTGLSVTELSWKHGVGEATIYTWRTKFGGIPGRRPQTKSYMWCFLGGPPERPVILYQYHPSRAAGVALQFFDAYHGALHCDGYSGYAPLLQSPDVIGLNCLAHVRRKFIEALPNGKEKGVSGSVVKMIRAIYKIEESLNRFSEADALGMMTILVQLSV